MVLSRDSRIPRESCSVSRDMALTSRSRVLEELTHTLVWLPLPFAIGEVSRGKDTRPPAGRSTGFRKLPERRNGHRSTR